MRYNIKKHFDLTLRRPQVLLFGNGFFHEECNWKDFIGQCKKENCPVSELYDVPYSIMADIITDVADDRMRREKYSNQLKNFNRITDINRKRLNELVKIKFDAIITTNYTYQIENQIDSRFSEYSDKTWREKYACCSLSKAKSNAGSSINIYNRVGNQDIWHMHGEAKRKSSIILTHDEYGRLVNSMIEELKSIGNKYQFYADDVKFKSWIDYLLMGDVYILGLGMDYSEFDLWWLLTRRMREKAEVGKVIFYEPYDFEQEHKYIALQQLGVKHETLDTKLPKDKNSDEINKIFDRFYNDAITDIAQKVKFAEAGK